ncbi:MAG: 3-deoxy-7-phosphoheptulonate synthase [Gammaproteobacteria bacterium]
MACPSILYPQLNRETSTLKAGFDYQDLHFSQDSFHLFAGLCAVDDKDNVKQTFQRLHECGQVCARMGAYKPRTNPYSFQGLGEKCLSYVFELAGQYGIRVIAMEVTHEAHIEAIHKHLEQLGHPTGIMLQVGTRNAQNFELLKALGQQTEYPILYKRGYANTLEESFQAMEYIAKSGNPKIVFCLRGVATRLSAPHRNLVDFAQIPTIKRLTSLSVCVDPSHAVGRNDRAPDHIQDIYHATAQGLIAGANMVLVDFHPFPQNAKVDSQQAIPLSDLEWFIYDLQITREAYLKRQKAAVARTDVYEFA